MNPKPLAKNNGNVNIEVEAGFHRSAMIKVGDDKGQQVKAILGDTTLQV